jgi:hypothetical protein
MRPKLVALIAASSVSVGWLLASVLVPPVAELQGLPDRSERRRPAPRDDAPTPYTEQLHLKLQQAPRAPVTRRNPFVFGARTAPAAASPAARVAKENEVDSGEPAIPAAPVVTVPSLRLSGVGSTAGVRTAVISDGTTVHLVKEGEVVNGYAVVEITDDAVTIADASGAQWKLRMR